MDKWDSSYRDPRISVELEDAMDRGYQKTIDDSKRRLAELQAKQRLCVSCVGKRVVAKEGYSEEEWAKGRGQSRCAACIWRENYNARFTRLL
jgi:hypothetical protein